MNGVWSVYFLALASGLLSGFSKFTLSMWLKDAGAGLLFLNLFTFTMIPSIFRPIWMPFVENFDIFPWKFGLKKNLIIFFDIIIFLMTMFLPVFHLYSQHMLPRVSQIVLIVFLVLYAAVIATRDALSLGYKMEFIAKEKIVEYEGIVSIAYQLGMHLTSGLFLILLHYTNWLYMFYAVLCVLGVVCIGDLFLKNSCYRVVEPMDFVTKFHAPYIDLLQRNEKFFMQLLLFLMFYQFADRMLIGNLNYYICPKELHGVGLGLNNQQFGALKTFASLVVILVNALSYYYIAYISLECALLISLILYSCVPLLLVLNIYFKIFGGYQIYGLMLIYLLDKVLKSLQWNILFSYQTRFISGQYMSSQNTLFAFFEKGFAMLLSPLFGWFLFRYDYGLFFLIAFLSVIPALFFTLLLFKKIQSTQKS